MSRQLPPPPLPVAIPERVGPELLLNRTKEELPPEIPVTSLCLTFFAVSDPPLSRTEALGFSSSGIAGRPTLRTE